MAKWNVGKKNGMWKGGRTISQHGYVLIRVGMDHHLADVRGYAYEHRLVAEEKLGRKLTKEESVHHINGNKQDNRLENIEILPNIAYHRYRHRTEAGKDLRKPWEANPLMSCVCGCGKTFKKYDKANRPRQYISGHNMRKIENG